MAWYPNAVVRNIPPGKSDPPITATCVALHVAASTTDSLYGYFNGPSGGVESHFYVRSSGVVEQYRDTAYQADAEAGGNNYAISIETAGLAGGTWNVAQIAAIVALIRWACDTHGIPARVLDSPTGHGIGWHSQWPTWNPDSHDCPGAARVGQITSTIIPALNQEDNVTPADISAIADAVWSKQFARGGTGPAAACDWVADTRIIVGVIDALVRGIPAAVATHGTDAASIASAIVAALPADLARQVADELGKRLSA